MSLRNYPLNRGVMKKLSLILILLLFSTESYSEGFDCYYIDTREKEESYYGIRDESFKFTDEELREYHPNFIILRKDNQFYEVNDWSNTHDFRVLDRLDIVFENDDLIHLYGRDNDDKTYKRGITMYSFNVDKVDGYFTGSITTPAKHLGYDGRCKIISDDEYSIYE
tara:strand:+ start:58 stop:558 length:501 start_codon:yes stop_codon:yes gene_type:complete